jgi:hypothetical protein
LEDKTRHHPFPVAHGAFAMPERRFPPPWSVEDPDPQLERQCFIIRDHSHVYLGRGLRKLAAPKPLP